MDGNACPALDEIDLAALLEERHAILEKLFTGGLSRADHVRLTWLRWQLDRLEAAGTFR